MAVVVEQGLEWNTPQRAVGNDEDGAFSAKLGGGYVQSVQSADNSATYILAQSDKTGAAYLVVALLWPENDEDFDGFTQQIVRRADHRNLDHVGYFRDNLLDFFRANSIAPGLEEVALSLNKKDKAVFIYSGEIARVQPAVPEERGRQSPSDRRQAGRAVDRFMRGED